MSGLYGYPTLIEILDHLPRTLCVQIAFDQLIINANSCQSWLSDLLASLRNKP
jgi:2-oxoglutarate dehydrogenase complex dehydrogenase (E1) component-like enzyme